MTLDGGLVARTSRLVRSVLDVPPARLLARVRFEAKQRVLPRLTPEARSRILAVPLRVAPPLRPRYLSSLRTELPDGWSLDVDAQPTLHFDLLGLRRSIQVPIDWDPKTVSRLWRFNLHYFEWAIKRLEHVYDAREEVNAVAQDAGATMEDWIRGNPFYQFDGWHPYTTSLRVVSWTYLLRAFPALAQDRLLASLWQQLRYLSTNTEDHAGGNHLLENLKALIVGGLQFQGEEADAIVRYALTRLTDELPAQVLADGCHVERSSSYHLQILTSMGEALACMRSAGWTPPATLVLSLEQMLGFARSMRLASGRYPLWNDAAYDAARPLDEVRAFTERLLYVSGSPEATVVAIDIGPLLRRLLESAQLQRSTPGDQSVEGDMVSKPVRAGPSLRAPKSPVVTSGLKVLRAGSLEVAFDGAPFGAPGLAGHGHADSLNVDVFVHGQPLIVEAGTSTYEAGPARMYERSTAAHNTVSIGHRDQSEVWGSFRTGRLARVLHSDYGTQGGWAWASAGHDGYATGPTSVTHHRWVGAKPTQVVILDQLDFASAAEFTLRFHLGPEAEVTDAQASGVTIRFGDMTLRVASLGRATNERLQWLPPDPSVRWYAPEFGVRIQRSTLSLKGQSDVGRRLLCTIIGEPGPDFSLESHTSSASLKRNSTTKLSSETRHGRAQPAGSTLLTWALGEFGPRADVESIL